MSYNLATNGRPQHVLSGFTSDGTNISIPIASIPELTAAEADASTGSAKKVISALLQYLHASLAAVPQADRPANLTITRNTSINDQEGTRTRFYSAQVKGSDGDFEVSDETGD